MQTPTGMAYQDLANAIVHQAADDYRNALNGKSYDNHPPEKIIKKIEKFFRSSWYRTLTKVDAEYLIEQLKREHFEKERGSNESNVNSGNA